MKSHDRSLPQVRLGIHSRGAGWRLSTAMVARQPRACGMRQLFLRPVQRYCSTLICRQLANHAQECPTSTAAHQVRLGMAGHRGVVTLGVPADVLVAAGGKGSWHDAPHSSVTAVALHSREWGIVPAAGGEAMRCLQTICGKSPLCMQLPPAGTLSEAARFQATCGS